jgi:uncharacterized protein (DUF39 family)
MAKTIKQINAKIKKGKAVVVTADEMTRIVSRRGVRKAAREVDVVTTGTFGPMCSSGAYFNIGSTKPRIKLGGNRCFLNDIPAYAGLAASDIFLGATALADDDPKNKIYPGEFNYGGGHVIEDFVAGKKIHLQANTYATDCYPRDKIDTLIDKGSINEANLFNVRNCYQNYNVAVNSSGRILYTYMGMLKPRFGNANYCSAGHLSPLLNDPLYMTIGIGSKIFLGGGDGFISWWGTQHNPTVSRNKRSLPLSPAGTLAVIGDLKQMKPEWLVGTSMVGYGVSLTVGIGVPIPVLNERVAFFTGVSDSDIYAPIIDYAKDYPQGRSKVLGRVSYADLRYGEIKLKRKKIATGSLSSYKKALTIARELKRRIEKKRFLLTEPVAKFPGKNSKYKFKALKESK